MAKTVTIKGAIKPVIIPPKKGDKAKASKKTSKKK